MTNEALTAMPEAENECGAEPAADTPAPSEVATPNEEQDEGIEVKYNKQFRRLSLSEARDYAEKGMKYDSLIPVLDRLKELSPDGSMSLAQLADHLSKEKEKRASDAAAAEEESRHNRLTEQYLQLKSKIPEIGSIREVPEQVIEQSLASGVPLYHAYLAYRHEQMMLSASADAAQKQAESAAAGSQADAPDRLSSPEIAAMLKGIWI